MGITKSEAFSPEQNQLATYAKALAHPARIAILQYLMRQKECICGDLVDVFDLSQSTISQHLRELKNSGLIQGNIDPPKVRYCVNPEGWKNAQKALEELFKANEDKGVSCC